MPSVTFTSMIRKIVTRSVIELPFNPHAAWGAKKRHDIHGTINGQPFRGPILSEGDRFFLVLGPAWCRGANLSAGAHVDVVLDSEGPQVDQLAGDISTALQNEPSARAFFESLPTFYRKNYIRWIESAKQESTRAARISEMIRLLVAGEREK